MCGVQRRVFGGDELPDYPQALEFRAFLFSDVNRAPGADHLLEIGIELDGAVDGVRLGITGEFDRDLERRRRARRQVYGDPLEFAATATPRPACILLRPLFGLACPVPSCKG